jgi:hypothetical protein
MIRALPCVICLDLSRHPSHLPSNRMLTQSPLSPAYMADTKVAHLNPTVRRALGNQPDSPELGSPDPPGSEPCPACHETGIVPVDGENLHLFRTCPYCRHPELQLLVIRVSPNHWIAVRDLPGLWGIGSSPVLAFLDLERRTPDNSSSFAQRYLRPVGEMSARQATHRRQSGRVA